MPTTTHNRLNAPTRLDHNTYSIDDPLSRIGEDEANFPDLLSLKDAHNLAKGPDDNLNHAGSLVSEFDNLYMDGNNPDDWTDSDPTKGIEGGTELLSLATKLNDPSYRPNKEKKAADAYFLDQMTFRQKVESDKQLIDKKAVEAHYGKPFEDATDELLKDVITDLDKKVDTFLKEKRNGTITAAHTQDLGMAVGSLKKLNALKDSVENDNYVIGSKSTAPADFMSAAENREATPNKRTTKAFTDSRNQFEKRQEILRNEDALYIGATKLKNGQFLDKNIQKVQKARQDYRRPVAANQSAAQTQPRTNPETARLQALAYNDQKAAVQNRYDIAVQNLATVSGNKSSDLRFRSVNSTKADTAHDEFSDAVFQMMQYDDQYKGVLSNPDLTNAERGAMINAYYVSKFSDLRKPMIDARGNNAVDKSANFIEKHKRKIKIGAFLLGGLTGGIGGVIAGAAVSIGLSKAAKRQITKRNEQDAADTGAAGTLSHLSSFESLTEVSQVTNSMRKDEMPSPQELRLIAQVAAENLRKQHEKTIEKYREEHVKRMLGSAATGLAWGGAIFLGGHMATGYLDYQLHGSGGWMDKLNHLDDPNGATPWRATVDKPWWMNINKTAVVTTAATIGAGALALKVASKNAKAQQQGQPTPPVRP